MNTSPNSSWFYSENNERKGPVPFSVLQDLLGTKLPKTTLVWTEGMEEWVAASAIPELSKSSPAPAQDPNNPYASPSTNPLPENPGGSLDLGGIPETPIPLDIGFCIKQGWNYTKANLGNLFVLGLVYFIISIVVSAILAGVAAAADNDIFVTLAGELVGQVFSLFLSMGLISYGHKLLKGGHPEIGDLFSQGSKMLSIIGATILFVIAVTIGIVLLIIPGIYLLLRLGLYQQAIVEKNLGAIDALKYSWELTNKNALSLLGLYILGFLITLAGLLALVIGLLWAIPTAWLSTLIAFRFLHGGPQAMQVVE